MNVRVHQDVRIGVCSWSLGPTSVGELARRVRDVGVSAVQLAIDPLRTGRWGVEETAEVLGGAGIAIRSGMIGMKGEDYTTLATIRRTGGVALDEHWEENLAGAKQAAEIAAELGVGLVTFHAGFIPHERADDGARGRLLERVRVIVDVFGARGIRVALETGQESAETLVVALEEIGRPADVLGVNFDPANMILYGMGDPVAAVRVLAPRVMQVHIKDAVPTTRAGEWGRETAAGTGAVDWEGFFGVMRESNIVCDLMIEREAGEGRVAEIGAARLLVERMMGRRSGQGERGRET